jgi:hypothetical protein
MVMKQVLLVRRLDPNCEAAILLPTFLWKALVPLPSLTIHQIDACMNE